MCHERSVLQNETVIRLRTPGFGGRFSGWLRTHASREGARGGYYVLIRRARAWRLLYACAPRLRATACGVEPAACGALPPALVDELTEGEYGAP